MLMRHALQSRMLYASTAKVFKYTVGRVNFGLNCAEKRDIDEEAVRAACLNSLF